VASEINKPTTASTTVIVVRARTWVGAPGVHRAGFLLPSFTPVTSFFLVHLGIDGNSRRSVLHSIKHSDPIVN
jgi:hypothetical protein